jgi:hypothetical protein
MIGSREISWDDLTELYRTHSILEQDDRVIIHAQEFTL